MKKIIKRTCDRSLESFLRICMLVFLFLSTAVSRVMAQADVNNVKHSFSAIKTEMQEKQAHDEFMSYVYMVFGFGAVIAIAWFSTANARKRSRREAEKKHELLMKLHDPSRRHLHKARR